MRIAFFASVVTALSTSLMLFAACGGGDTAPTATFDSTNTPSESLTSANSNASTEPGPASSLPAPDGYRVAPVLSADYLGAAAGPAIELALVQGSDNEAILALQNGTIYHVLLDSQSSPEEWGDIRNLMPGVNLDSAGEQGLLSVAFSPNFLEDGRVYLYYTRGSPSASVLSRFQASTDGLDEDSEEVLIEVPQFAGNHNGGHIAFDQGGHLLLSLGDGGGAGDPNENGQNTDTLLGSVLRIDVSPDRGYEIPPDNPFGNEVYAYGFRNPWRMAVDSLSGEIWLGDVGQNAFEEVTLVEPGANHGWDCYEGFEEYEPDGCADDTFVEPVAAYGHDLGRSVTGGFVYRGEKLAELRGWYVYGDFYSGRLWAVSADQAANPIQLTDADLNIASFAELPDGELLVVSYFSGVFQLERD